MTKLELFILVAASVASFGLSNAHARGGKRYVPTLADQPGNSPTYCTVLHSDQSDDAGQRCSQGYAVAQNGRIVEGCFDSIEDAAKSAKKNPACYYSGNIEIGGCRVLYWDESDLSSRRCSDRKYPYAVAQNGFILGDGCFENIADAINLASRTKACMYAGRITYGNCSVLYPIEQDATGSYCSGRKRSNYAVLYQGRIVNSTCYETLNETLASMKSLSVCTLGFSPKSVKLEPLVVYPAESGVASFQQKCRVKLLEKFQATESRAFDACGGYHRQENIDCLDVLSTGFTRVTIAAVQGCTALDNPYGVQALKEFVDHGLGRSILTLRLMNRVDSKEKLACVKIIASSYARVTDAFIVKSCLQD